MPTLLALPDTRAAPTPPAPPARMVQPRVPRSQRHRLAPGGTHGACCHRELTCWRASSLVLPQDTSSNQTLSQTKARLHFHSSFTCLREGCWPHAPESTLFLGRPRGAPGTPVPISEKFGDAPARSPGLRLTPWFGKVGSASLVLTSKIRLYQCHLYVSKQIKCF